MAAGWGASGLSPQLAERVEIRVKYQGYIDRQRSEARRFAHQEALAIPPDLDYHGVVGLSVEVREKLSAARPLSLGQAARIPGVTPAALSVLLVHLRRRNASP